MITRFFRRYRVLRATAEKLGFGGRVAKNKRKLDRNKSDSQNITLKQAQQHLERVEALATKKYKQSKQKLRKTKQKLLHIDSETNFISGAAESI